MYLGLEFVLSFKRHIRRAHN